MSGHPVSFDRQTRRRLLRAVRSFWNSEVRWQARGMFALLIAFALVVNGLNVVNSYVGRDFMTAIAHRDSPGFVRQAFYYVGVFAALTVTAVLYRFTEERLGLFWRVWFTRRITRQYLQDRDYLRLKEQAVVDNPDQRIAEDVRGFTTTTLSFTLMFMNGALAAISFSGVLWAISPMLFGVAVAYAALGTLTAIYLGRPLVGLNYRQSDQEANFRTELIRVGQDAESIAILRREGHFTARLLRRIDGIAANFRQIISLNRNLGFFTTGYNYLIQIIPTLVVAPLFIRGEIEFGVVTQSAMAFAQLLGAFSLIVNQIQSLSSFAAVVARLSTMAEAAEFQAPTDASPITIETNCRVGYLGLTLTSGDGSMLIRDLNVQIPLGTRALIHGPNESARVALFRATAGIGGTGHGKVICPPLTDICFLPQRPYLPPGTLRELLMPGPRDEIPESRLQSVLTDVGLESILKRVGGIDVERNWTADLSLADQQQLALIRLILTRPTFAMLDRVSDALKPDQFRRYLERLTENSITYVSLSENPEAIDLYDSELEIKPDGSWNWKRLGAERPSLLANQSELRSAKGVEV